MIWTSLIAQGKRQLWMSLFIATLLAVVFFHFARFYQSSLSPWLAAAGALPLALLWLRAAIRLLSHLDRQPFRALDLGLADDHVAPGQSFEITLRVEARRAATLARVAAELRCTRVRVAERGRDHVVLSSEETVAAEEQVLREEETTSYAIALPVPEDAPYSFRSMEGRIAWSIHVAIDVRDWGELRDEVGVTVAPR